MPQLEYSLPKDHDPAWYADGSTRRFSNDALGLWLSRCFLEGGVTCVDCHSDPHDTEIEKNPAIRPESNADLHTVPRSHCAGRHRSHPARCEERRKLLRRVPHAAERREHQGEDPRPRNQPASAREHRTARNPERLQRMPPGPHAGLGGGHDRRLVSREPWPPSEASRPRGRLQPGEIRKRPGSRLSARRARRERIRASPHPGQCRRVPGTVSLRSARSSSAPALVRLERADRPRDHHAPDRKAGSFESGDGEAVPREGARRRGGRRSYGCGLRSRDSRRGDARRGRRT